MFDEDDYEYELPDVRKLRSLESRRLDRKMLLTTRVEERQKRKTVRLEITTLMLIIMMAELS